MAMLLAQASDNATRSFRVGFGVARQPAGRLGALFISCRLCRYYDQRSCLLGQGIDSRASQGRNVGGQRQADLAKKLYTAGALNLEPLRRILDTGDVGALKF
jgi:hypothetical protein